MSNGPAPEVLTADSFRTIIGSRFHLSTALSASGPAVSVDLELAEVNEHTGPRDAFRAPFSLLFHGPLAPVMPQASYPLQHGQLGPLDLFIVPLGPQEPAAPGQAPTAMRYEAVFG
jgi:hypothetical protein